MYSDEEIFMRISRFKRNNDNKFSTLLKFWKAYKARYRFPSLSLIYKRYRGVGRLLSKVEQWEKKEITLSITGIGKYISKNGDAFIEITPNGELCKIRVTPHPHFTHYYEWELPRIILT